MSRNAFRGDAASPILVGSRWLPFVSLENRNTRPIQIRDTQIEIEIVLKKRNKEDENTSKPTGATARVSSAAGTQIVGSSLFSRQGFFMRPFLHRRRGGQMKPSRWGSTSSLCRRLDPTLRTPPWPRAREEPSPAPISPRGLEVPLPLSVVGFCRVRRYWILAPRL